MAGPTLHPLPPLSAKEVPWSRSIEVGSICFLVITSIGLITWFFCGRSGGGGVSPSVLGAGSVVSATGAGSAVSATGAGSVVSATGAGSAVSATGAGSAVSATGAGSAVPASGEDSAVPSVRPTAALIGTSGATFDHLMGEVDSPPTSAPVSLGFSLPESEEPPSRMPARSSYPSPGASLWTTSETPPRAHVSPSGGLSTLMGKKAAAAGVILGASPSASGLSGFHLETSGHRSLEAGPSEHPRAFAGSESTRPMTLGTGSSARRLSGFSSGASVDPSLEEGSSEHSRAFVGSESTPLMTAEINPGATGSRSYGTSVTPAEPTQTGSLWRDTLSYLSGTNFVQAASEKGQERPIPGGVTAMAAGAASQLVIRPKTPIQDEYLINELGGGYFLKFLDLLLEINSEGAQNPTYVKLKEKNHWPLFELPPSSLRQIYPQIDTVMAGMDATIWQNWAVCNNKEEIRILLQKGLSILYLFSTQEEFSEFLGKWYFAYIRRDADNKSYYTPPEPLFPFRFLRETIYERFQEKVLFSHRWLSHHKSSLRLRLHQIMK